MTNVNKTFHNKRQEADRSTFSFTDAIFSVDYGNKREANVSWLSELCGDQLTAGQSRGFTDQNTCRMEVVASDSTQGEHSTNTKNT